MISGGDESVGHGLEVGAEFSCAGGEEAQGVVEVDA